MKPLSNILLIGFLTFALLEIIIRLCGVTPFQVQSYDIQSKPKFCLLPNERYGFGLNVGTFDVVINKKVQYSCTHNTDSLRLLSNKPIRDFSKTIDIHGCSFTYGMSISDSLTFPFLLQNHFPHTQFRNFAVPGFGNIQTLIRLQEQIKTGDLPNIVMLCYADFHDERNVLNLNYRKSLYHGFLNANETILPLFKQSQIPFYNIENGIQYCSWDELYDNWKGRHYFAAINSFQDAFEKMALKNGKAETHEILKQIHQLCEQNKVKFIVVTITKSESTDYTIHFCKTKNITVWDIGLELPSEQYSNLPYDIHPNEKAHLIFSERLRAMLDF